MVCIVLPEAVLGPHAGGSTLTNFSGGDLPEGCPIHKNLIEKAVTGTKGEQGTEAVQRYKDEKARRLAVKEAYGQCVGMLEDLDEMDVAGEEIHLWNTINKRLSASVEAAGRTSLLAAAVIDEDLGNDRSCVMTDHV